MSWTGPHRRGNAPLCKLCKRERGDYPFLSDYFVPEGSGSKPPRSPSVGLEGGRAALVGMMVQHLITSKERSSAQAAKEHPNSAKRAPGQGGDGEEIYWCIRRWRTPLNSQQR